MSFIILNTLSFYHSIILFRMCYYTYFHIYQVNISMNLLSFYFLKKVNNFFFINSFKFILSVFQNFSY